MPCWGNVMAALCSALCSTTLRQFFYFLLFNLYLTTRDSLRLKISFAGVFWPKWTAIHQFHHKLLQHRQTRHLKNSYMSLSQFPFAE